MPDRVGIFIDGAYLDNILRNEWNNRRINFRALSESVAGGMDILRTYYYHCLPYQSPNPTDHEINRYASKRRFFAVLENLPLYTVRLGRLALQGNREDGSPIFAQKRVDILLGVDMVLLSAKGHICEAILIAGDSDFVPAVEAAKSEGVIVRLFHGNKSTVHNDLLKQVDDRTPLPITENLLL